MPIPVGRSGNVDGEGGTTDSIVRTRTVADAWGMADIPEGDRMRKWLVAYSLQPGGSIRWSWSTSLERLAEQSPRLRTAAVELARALAELADHADDHGADGS
jgi:hypothetical protein